MRLSALLAISATVVAATIAAGPAERAGGHLVGNRAAAAAVGIEWGGPDAPIRPGAEIPGCTMNWAFFDEVTGVAYVGTAAHCTEQGERFEVGSLGEVGTVVFDSDDVFEGNDDLERVDFSLIELDPEFVSQTDPEMLTWGGPHGYVTPDELSVGDVIVIHGYGMVVGEVGPTRGNRGGVLTTWDEDEYITNMAAVNGDSGASLLHRDSGLALGIISRWNLGVPPSTDIGPMLPFIFRALGAAGFNDVVLATVD